MKVKTITYQRVKNLGNYESERLELTAEVDCDIDDIFVSINTLKAIVLDRLEIEPIDTETYDEGVARLERERKELIGEPDEELEDIPW